MRRAIVALSVTFVVALSGVAAASVHGGASRATAAGAGHPGPLADDPAQHEAGPVHGGPIERFHETGSCDLTAVGSPAGNWTHGDYVGAVAANGGPTQTQRAAHSDCGKPIVAVGHGGLSAFTQRNAADGQAQTSDRHILNDKPDGATESPSS